ncbi:hypothetical protein HPB50_003226 [Hyalomma asiaticum]|uniref:Uncharacterized protein n=1 Tax=Hyalomma asiaticum TaxID=266040 RepID=A0ACB7RN45_HYAAI|nr:hypothetical protein HPB50_003226 [Hyalomma asiaticum]
MAHERRCGKQPGTSAPVIAARLSDLLSRCRPTVVTHATDGRSSAAHAVQSRLAQMPWCYQGPLRHAGPTSPETMQDDQPDLDEGDDSGTLERDAPYLDFLASLTEHLVLQPDLSDE